MLFVVSSAKAFVVNRGPSDEAARLGHRGLVFLSKRRVWYRIRGQTHCCCPA